jgi:hypothetical protein
MVNPRGHLKTRHQFTAKHLDLALMQGMLLIKKNLHKVPSIPRTSNVYNYQQYSNYSNQA